MKVIYKGTYGALEIEYEGQIHRVKRDEIVDLPDELADEKLKTKEWKLAKEGFTKPKKSKGGETI